MDTKLVENSDTTTLLSRNATKPPAPAPPKGMKPIILVVMLERLTYYSILANLLLYFKYDVYRSNDKTTQDDSSKSSKTVLLLSGLSWLMCVAGGWVSDSKLGKLKTIIAGLVFDTIGMGLLFGSAILLTKHDLIQEPYYRALLVCGCILVLLVGEGAYKANISPFGAEQLSKHDENSTRRFFNYYYFSVNVGAFFGFSVVAYFQQENGFVIGFAIPFGSITLALIIFVSQRRHYKADTSQRILGKVFQIMNEARKKRRKKARNIPAFLTTQMPWLDYAKLKNGGSYLDWEVEDVKLLFRVIPVFLVLIPYGTIYSQMHATFLEQGIHMRINISDFNMPAAWLNIFNTIIIVTLIPIMEKVVYPSLAKQGYTNSPIGRITFGILIACLSIIAAGFVEIFVVDDLKNNRTLNQMIDRQITIASTISVFWQIPQYTLIGISEVFAVVAGLEFAYRNAPKSMQSIVMALYFMTNSIGYLVGSAVLELSELCRIIPPKRYFDYGDHTYYFFLLCGLLFVSWFAFMFYITHSEYADKKTRRARMLRTRFFGRSSVNLRQDQADG